MSVETLTYTSVNDSADSTARISGNRTITLATIVSWFTSYKCGSNVKGIPLDNPTLEWHVKCGN